MGFFDEFSKSIGKKTGEGAGQGINNVFGFVWEIFRAAFFWMFAFEKTNQNESFVQKNALRLTVIMLIIGMLSISRCSISPTTSVSSASQTNDSNSVMVIVNLDYGLRPIMPDDERFIPMHEERTLKYTEIQGIRYVSYMQMANGDPVVISVPRDGQYCFIVPKKMFLRFVSTIPPRHVVNMDNKVFSTIAPGALSTRDMLFSEKVKDKNLYHVMKSWLFLRNNWEFVEKEEYATVAQASERDPGGLVCF